MGPKISIHIPVFNGEKYIRATLESIRAQDFADFEVVCVDDCSTDKSLGILRDYEKIDSRFRVFKTGQNLGDVPKVLKSYFQEIRGEMWVYSSQDDVFSKDWLGCMYRRILETGADATIPDLVFFHEGNPQSDVRLTGVNGDRKTVLSGRDAFRLSLNWTIPGNALWRIHLLRGIGFFDFGMNADEYTVRKWFLGSNTVAFSCGTFYYRQDNPDAITKVTSLKSFDIPFTDFQLWKLCVEESFDSEVANPLLIASVMGLVGFASLTFCGEFRGELAAGVITKCYDAYKDEDAFGYLWGSPDFGRRTLLALVALKNRRLFIVLSFLVFAKREVRKTLRKLVGP